jgi:hypothetical protein
MRSLDFIVDDDGEVWGAPFDGLRLALGCDANADVFIRYVIRNLGFLRLEQRRHGLVVTVRPSATNPVTFASALFLISDFASQRVLLSYLEDVPAHVLCGGTAEAREKLLCAMDQAEDVSERCFVSERRGLDEAPANSSISRLLALWGDCQGAFDDQQLTTALRTILRERYALLSTQANGETLIIENWGYGGASFESNWLRMCRGLQFEDQPDYRYGRAAAVAYREVLRSGEPLFDYVDATTSNAGHGKRRIAYRRLIVPIRKRDCQPWLLSTSLLDPSIDLRKAGCSKPR